MTLIRNGENGTSFIPPTTPPVLALLDKAVATYANVIISLASKHSIREWFLYNGASQAMVGVQTVSVTAAFLIMDPWKFTRLGSRVYLAKTRSRQRERWINGEGERERVHRVAVILHSCLSCNRVTSEYKYCWRDDR